MRIGIFALLLVACAADAASSGKSAPLAAVPTSSMASSGFTRGGSGRIPDPRGAVPLDPKRKINEQDCSKPVDSQHEHCTFCFAGAALPATHVPHGVDGASFLSPKAVSFTPRSFTVVSADARAPPVFPLAHFDNQHGRTNEKAFALYAARSDMGGSFVRLGILLG